MGAWAWFWIAWAGLGVAAELLALARSGPADTLSYHVWLLLSNQTWGKFASWMLAAFLLWLAVHFVTRGKWG